MLPTKDELRERYAGYSNNRLLLIIHRRNEYTSEALEVAKAELANREITAADIDQFLDQREEQRAMAEAYSCVPLSFWEKCLFFFAWFVIFGRAIQTNYSEDGMLLKMKQCRVFALAGFVSMIIEGIIIVYFKPPTGTSVILFTLLFLAFVLVEKKVVYEITV